MSDTVVAAIIGIAGAILVGIPTALYTIGGKGALQRRVIQQERDIAHSLDDGVDRDELLDLVRRRVTVYLSRATPIPAKLDVQRTKWVLIWLGIGVIAFVGGLALDSSVEEAYSWQGIVSATAVVIGSLILVVGMGVAVGLAIGDLIAQRQWLRFARAETRMAERRKQLAKETERLELRRQVAEQEAEAAEAARRALEKAEQESHRP